MSRSNDKESVGNLGDLVDQVELDNNSATAQEQVLLEALQGFILPHIGAAIDADRQKEMAQKLAGPQAKKLVAALKEFISSLVGMSAKTEVETTIEVALDEEEQSDLSPDDVEDEETKELNFRTPVVMYNKVLLALRRYVFNKMPIRLLRFDQKGLILEISLIERAAIYEHLVSILPAWPNNEYKLIPVNFSLEIEDEVISRIVEKYSGYAILSHTWLRQSPEVTHGDWKAKSFDEKGPGYRKLVNFCKVAYSKHKLTLGWMDTVCINKDSSSELDESIRSMYKWYERSQVCIVHLADTNILDHMHNDTWFTRGWTLQELLAPSVLKFYNEEWVPLVDSENDKEDNLITTKIGEATTISISELRDIHVFAPMSRRLQLAAPRKVTREEDTAYSLMGLFNVSFTTAYGEGVDRAFYRLLQEILNSKSYGVLDLFNCAGTEFSSTSQLLPSSPRQHLERYTYVNLQRISPVKPLMLTHMGVRIPLLLMPGISIHDDYFGTKPCGDYSAVVCMSPVQCYRRPLPTTYALLQQHNSNPDSNPSTVEGRHYQLTFAVFNFRRDEKGIYIPSNCIAIPLACYEDAGKVTSTGNFQRVYTWTPVVFKMLERNLKQYNSSAEDYMVALGRNVEVQIPQEELTKHGIQLVFKYI